ncbi:hypothetical protein CK934_08160 [Chitinophaga sp. MD30]|nr:hypothetical protein CK934_08160 [Chitinophaga sp. MD30]
MIAKCAHYPLPLWKYFYRYITTLCLLLSTCCYTHAQTWPVTTYNIHSYAFRHLSIKDGLASNHVSAILQDRRGFIWIANTALQRYDGSNLVTVASFDRVPGSIYYDDICLCEDRKGRIWIGAPDYVRVYDPVTATLRAIKMDIIPEEQSNLRCSRIIEDHTGTIWVTTHEGLLRLDENSGHLQKAAMIPEDIRRQMNSAIMEDEHGNLWISGNKGIFMLDKDRKSIYSKANNPARHPLLEVAASVKKIYLDSRRNIWAAARNDVLYAYDQQEKQLDTFLFPAPPNMPGDNQLERVFDITEDMYGNIWVATELSGIYRYDIISRKFGSNIRANNADDLGLHYDYETNCFLNDRDGHLWIGTDIGINILSVHNTMFQVLDQRTAFIGTKEHLPRAEVTGLFQASNGDIYAGYWGKGMSWFNEQLQLKRNFQFTGRESATSLPEERSLVWSFAETKDGKVLVGQENGLLSVFDPAKGLFTVHHHPNKFHDQTLLNMDVVNDTLVWIGLYKRGLVRWNPQNNMFTAYPELITALHRPTSVMDIIPAGDSSLWLATSTSGLILFNRYTHAITDRTTFKNDSWNISNVTCLYRFDDSTLVAGTDHGLWIYNTKRKQYQALKVNGRLFDEWVLSIQSNGKDKLWFTTQYGFYRFNRKDFRLETFVQSDDIIDNDRKVRRYITSLRNGHLLVGASDHFMAFDTSVLMVAAPPPDVTILSMKAMDSTINIDAAPNAYRNVSLSYKQNFISIEFKSLQYHHEKLRYFYQLEGVDENWVNAEGLLIARYTNLPPGSYTFKVRSVNSAGTFSQHITEIRINIRPAFWQTAWFKLLCFLGAMGLAYLYFRMRIYYVKKEEKRRAAIQQQMAQLEMKALRAQMNPHFIFNALNSIQTFMMKSQTEEALAYLGRFARLIRNVLDNSSLNSIPISKEVDMLENYMELEKLRFTDQFEYTIEVDPELDADFVEIPSMLIQPFIENAIWHGLLHKKEKGKLLLAFRKINDRILCIIEDNGLGRERSQAIKQMSGHTHHSRGLQITRDRLSIYNNRYNMDASFDIQDLYDENGNALGTRINLWFPLIEE